MAPMVGDESGESKEWGGGGEYDIGCVTVRVPDDNYLSGHIRSSSTPERRGIYYDDHGGLR